MGIGSDAARPETGNNRLHFINITGLRSAGSDPFAVLCIGLAGRRYDRREGCRIVEAELEEGASRLGTERPQQRLFRLRVLLTLLDLHIERAMSQLEVALAERRGTLDQFALFEAVTRVVRYSAEVTQGLKDHAGLKVQVKRNGGRPRVGTSLTVGSSLEMTRSQAWALPQVTAG